MRKSFVIFTACFGLFSMSVVGCKNSEENNDNIEAVETEVETESDAVHDSSKELEHTAVVPSGTYRGIAEVVDAQQKEIYVKLNDTATIELYFSNDTEIMRNGESVTFDALEQGQRLELEVEKVNNQLNPKKVTILE